MSARYARGKRWFPVFACLVTLVLLTGCDSGVGSYQPSPYDPALVFKDPKAQKLALAAQNGNANAVYFLMKDKGINPDGLFGEEGMPLIAWPVFTQSPEGLKAMLENGADPNARIQEQIVKTYEDGSVGRYFVSDNAMIWAAKQDDPIYLKLLLDHGGNPNTRNANDETLLLQAFLWSNQWQNVQLLVERGADVNAKSQDMSPISDYTSQGRFEQAYWLLQHGADPTEGEPQSAENHSPVIDAIFWHPGSPASRDWQRKCQQWLLQHGYARPALPSSYRRMRQNLGFPYEEKDIPLL